jgi:hypothetical protein
VTQLTAEISTSTLLPLPTSRERNKWWQYFRPIRRYLRTKLHGDTSQKILLAVWICVQSSYSFKFLQSFDRPSGRAVSHGVSFLLVFLCSCQRITAKLLMTAYVLYFLDLLKCAGSLRWATTTSSRICRRSCIAYHHNLNSDKVF